MTTGFLMFLEFSGISTSTPFDVSANNFASGATSLAIGPTAALAVADSLAVVGLFHTSAGQSAHSFSDSFTLVTGNSQFNVGYKILASTSAVSTTASWTTARNSLGVLAVYEGA
jgi:hypothetical protein